MKSLPSHPAANLFPDMAAEEYNRLVQDIREHGQREAIYTYQGQILDGRHRYRACQQLKLEPILKEYTGRDPVDFVVSVNLHRRHLDVSQRAMVAAAIATMRKGDNQHKQSEGVSRDTPSLEQAAKNLNVGRATVARAKEVLKSGDETLIKSVVDGTIPVSTAAKMTEMLPEERKAAMETGSRKKQPRKRKHAMAGKHYATRPEVMQAVENIKSCVQEWEKMGGLKKMVSTWESKDRWSFCDELERLLRYLRRHVAELRHR